jgi:hypothetical protein
LSGPDALNRDRPDLPLPRWGVLSGKSLCTCRRWRLFFVQLRSFGAGKESGIPFIILFGGEMEKTFYRLPYLSLLGSYDRACRPLLV